MIRPKIIDYELDFGVLSRRYSTDKIVIHHTGNSDRQGNYVDDDLSAEEIHELHQNMGWVGIGYHFVVRKDGTIEQGRPIWSQGAHAQGENYHTVGIHVCGNFEIAYPTTEQIEALSYLVGWVAEKYDIKANINGGGYTGQSQALRLAIARALVKINADDKAALRKEGFMTRDPRAVERKKPGQPKARRRFQFSKR